ncbi:unnamed protein product [Calypogeia fissa]
MAPPSNIPVEQLKGKESKPKRLLPHLHPEYVEATARLANLARICREVGLCACNTTLKEEMPGSDLEAKAEAKPAVKPAVKPTAKPVASDAQSSNYRTDAHTPNKRRRST